MIAVLEQLRQLSPEVRHFDFLAPGVSELSFLPGQFVSLVHEVSGKPITRAYSIASAPHGNRFSLCLNRVEDGHLSPWLFSLVPGDGIEFTGPLGTFTVRNPQREIVMVATGTGIAPFRSMLEHSLAAMSRCTLVFGVRYEANLLYREDLERWSREHTQFDFRPTLSRPGPGWRGRAGHVQEHVLQAIGERRNLDVYVCGLKAMVDDMRARLKAVGFERRQIIVEKFD